MRSARLLIVALALFVSGSQFAGAQPLTALSDAEFWRLVSETSEAGGAFPQQLMSNEDSAQFVMPALERRGRTGGAYLGVGEEQNFTYLATLRPAIAFIVDIRRDNLVELLLYKAIFELSDTRADFLFRLFSRARPADLKATPSVEELFTACDTAASTSALLDENVRAVLAQLTRAHAFRVSDADQSTIRRMMGTIQAAGPRGLKGYGDRTNPTYEQVMTATDLDGRQHSVLASESRFRTVRALEAQNRIVPVVDDFAGGTALRAIGRFLGEHQLVVNAFYVSNVERYLFDQGPPARQFYTNVATLPIDDESVFVRSVITDITDRLGIPVAANPARWRTLLFPIREALAKVNDGRITSYRDLFVGSK